jgi:hypothetical protein
MDITTDVKILTPEETERAIHEHVVIDFGSNVTRFHEAAAALMTASFDGPNGVRALAAANVSLVDLIEKFEAVARALEEGAKS